MKTKSNNIGKIQRIHFRAVVSVAMVVSLIASWSLGSVAASPSSVEPPAPSVTVVMPSDNSVVGQLTVKKGDVSINGNASQTGATVLSGNVINTSSGGEAIIDLGEVGLVELGSRTTVTLSFEPTYIGIRSECGRSEIKVFLGQVNVTSPKVETIQATHDEDYKHSVEATAPAGSHFRVECERSKLIFYLPLGLSGLAFLALRRGEGEVLSAPPSGELPPVTPTTP